MNLADQYINLKKGAKETPKPHGAANKFGRKVRETPKPYGPVHKFQRKAKQKPETSCTNT